MQKLRSTLVHILRDDLLRHVSILFSGMLVVHVCSIIFQMAVSRALPDAEYTLLMAFLAVLAMIQRPLSTLSTGVSHYTSLLRQGGRLGDVSRILRKWLLLCGGAGLVLGMLTVVWNEPVAGVLHLERSAPVVIGGLILPALFCLPVLGGAAQGVQLFSWCSASTIFGALIRLVMGAGFVWFLYPACGWAMLGHGLGVYASGGLLFLGLFLTLHGKSKTKSPLPSMRVYLFQSFFIQAAYAVLMTADVVLIKHYVPEDTEFAYAATLGRMVVFLPGAIVGAMFPKVASHGAGTREQYNVFLRSLKLTALCVLVAVGGCFLLSGPLARILFGVTEPSAHLNQMIGWMSFVMGLSALLKVIVQYFVAQRRFLSVFPLVGFALLYLLGVSYFHSATWEIVMVAGICNGGALLFCIVSLLWHKHVQE